MFVIPGLRCLRTEASESIGLSGRQFRYYNGLHIQRDLSQKTRWREIDENPGIDFWTSTCSCLVNLKHASPHIQHKHMCMHTRRHACSLTHMHHFCIANESFSRLKDGLWSVMSSVIFDSIRTDVQFHTGKHTGAVSHYEDTVSDFWKEIVLTTSLVLHFPCSHCFTWLIGIFYS